MGQGNGDKSLREEAWDAGLRALFGAKEVTGESVLAAIEEATGASAQVLLRDEPGDESPLLKLHPPDSEEAAKDDSRYQVVGEIARGGVGVIFKGRDRDLGRDVAIKVLRKEHAARPEIVQRFIEEAQIEGQLQHPGIIPVYGLGLQPDGRPYFAMKLVKGKTLSAVLSERKEPGEDRSRYLAMFEQVAQAMAYAHARGVIHRDLKPSNILVGAFGEVLVVDWGFAKVLGTKEPEAPKGPATPPLTIVATVRTTGDGSESIAGSVMGTPAYMPPEQALGHVEQLDTRSDVFALGAILAEILTGEPPYVGESDDQLVMASQARLDDAHARLDACGADPEIVKLCRKCLAPLKGDRPRDASAPAMAISEHLAAQEERAREAEVDAARERARAVKEKSESERERAREASERRKVKWERLARRRTIGVAAALLLAVLLGGGAFLKMQGDKRTRAERAQAAVARAVEEAELLRGEKRWPEAIEKARAAAELANVEGVPEETRTETAALLQAVEAEQEGATEQAARVERDRRFVRRLEEIYLERADRVSAQQFDAALEGAFREFGIDIQALEPKEAGDRIASTTEPAAIAAALDSWAWLASRRPELSERDGTRLIEVARVADPDPWRDRMRAAISTGDIAALREMAAIANVDELPVSSIDALAMYLARVGDPQAIELLERAQRRHADSFWINYHLAFQLTRSQPDAADAPRFAAAAVALRPESGMAWNNLGLTLERARRWDRAIAAFRRAISLESDPPAWRYTNLADVFLKRGDTQAAAEVCAQLLDLDPDSPNALAMMAKIHNQKGEFDQAIQSCERALQLDADFADAYQNMARALALSGRCEKAVQTARKGMELRRFPGSRAICLANIGSYYARAGRLDKAQRAYLEALETHPTLYLAHLGLGDVHSRLGDFEEALRVAKSALRLAPDRPDAHVLVGSIHLKEGEFAEAEKAYRRAIELGPRTVAALANLGLLLLARGEEDEAVELCERAVQAAPYSVNLHRFLARAYIATNRLDEAIESCRTALRLDERNIPALGLLATALEMNAELHEAIQRLHEVIGIDPDAWASRAHLARLLQRENRWDEAIEHLRAALDHAPNDPKIRSSLASQLAICIDEREGR